MEKFLLTDENKMDDDSHLTQKEIEVIFGNVKSILTLNQNFQEILLSQYQNYSARSEFFSCLVNNKKLQLKYFIIYS